MLRRVGPRPALVKSTTLILGGARSGKSRAAEALFADEPSPLYVATAEALDDEMRARIERHRADRGARWRLREAPVELALALEREPGPALVDCLTLWVSNLLLGGHDIALHAAALERALAARRPPPRRGWNAGGGGNLAGRLAPTVLVSNEVGLGIVPGDALSRRFRDEAGVLNQRVAAAADRVLFVAAGLPIVLKG